MAKKDKKKKREKESVIDIDQDDLVEEWKNQPRLYLEWSSKLADARKKLEEAKATIDVVTAELDDRIRTSPDKYDLEKVTENSVKACILRQEAHAAATSSFQEAKHEVDMLGAMVGALDHRKRALENIVQLWAAQYFSSPSLTAKSLDSVDKRGKRDLRGGRGDDD